MEFIENRKLQALLLASAIIVCDVWLFSLRCPSSPEIDWSRFAFAGTLQLAAVAIPIVAFEFHWGTEAKSRSYAWVIAVFLGIASMPMVRAAVLLSDTIQDKFYDSGGYQCPGVKWR